MDYLTEIRAVQPHGPYRLVGNCIGGIVAFEMGRQLEHAGEEVRTLVMMDTDYPTRAKSLGKRGTRRFAQFSQRWNIGYYAGRAAYHLRALGSIPWSRKWLYIAGKSQLAISDIVTIARTVTVDPAEAVRLSYQDALRRYVPGEYRGAVDIIVNENEAEDAEAGWSRLVSGRITVHIAPGNHESYIHENVHVTARQLRECLQRYTSLARVVVGTRPSRYFWYRTTVPHANFIQVIPATAPEPPVRETSCCLPSGRACRSIHWPTRPNALRSIACFCRTHRQARDEAPAPNPGERRHRVGSIAI